MKSFMLVSLVLLSGVVFARHHRGMDKATLDVQVTDIDSKLYDRIIVRGQNTDCWNCSFSELCVMNATEQDSCPHIKLYSNHTTDIKIFITSSNGTHQICPTINIAVEENAQYRIMIRNLHSPSIKSSPKHCNFITIDHGQASNLPILYMFILLIGMSVLWIIIKVLYRKGLFDIGLRFLINRENEALVQADLGSTNASPDETIVVPKKARRLRSLDTFRGFSLSIMIFVNYGGGGYWFFQHSSWNGLTVADLVFPWFVFIMGTAVGIVFNNHHRRSTSVIKIFFEILLRSVKLFVLGLMVNSTGAGGNDITKLRIPGVLQRFSVTYFIVSVTELIFSRGYKTHHLSQVEKKWFTQVADIVLFWPSWIVALLCILCHALVSLYVPYNMDNCPTGYLQPGGISGDPLYSNCTGGISKYIDLQVFGQSHIYQHGTCKKLYGCNNFDPEGLLGCLTSVFICFLGVQAGRILTVYSCPKAKTCRLVIWACVTAVIGLLLCGASQNDGWIPINKNLWSASFVLVLGGMAFFLLAFMYVLIDVTDVWTGAPFFFPGMNSIFVYMGSETLEDLIPVSFTVANTHLAQLFINLWSTSFWVILSAYMYYKKIFVSV